MIFDTDVFIWVQRRNARAAKLIDDAEERHVSVFSYMELLQGARDKKQHQYVNGFLKDLGFSVLPLTENIGHRAAVYVEEYSLSHRLRAGDAIVAATATQHGLTLCTSNAKHFKHIRELKLKLFRPR